MTFDEFWKHYVGGDKDKSLETGRIYAASAWDYQQARIEALEKDFAYHSELCTIQQARIDELEAAAERYSDNGHFPDCAVNDWTTADCNCGLAELEALLPGGGE